MKLYSKYELLHHPNLFSHNFLLQSDEEQTPWDDAELGSDFVYTPKEFDQSLTGILYIVLCY